MVCLSGNVCAQLEQPVTWSFSAKLKNKSEAILSMKAVIRPGWHIFSQHVPAGGPTATSVVFVPSNEFDLIGAMSEPKGLTYYEKLFKMDLSYFEKEVSFLQAIKLRKPHAVAAGKLEFMACSATACLPPDEVEFKIPLN